MTTKDEDILAAWAEFFVAHALSVRAVEAEMEGRAPLSLDEYDVLLVLSRVPGQELRLSALAEATVYTKSGITRIVRRLEGHGYLSRRECADDKRGSFAVLTEEGKKALRDSWRFYRAAILKVLDPCYTKGEAQQLAKLLQRISDRLTGPQLVTIRARFN